jgi:hypothetical protein
MPDVSGQTTSLASEHLRKIVLLLLVTDESFR